VRVLIVTDPQLTDAYSYKQRGLRLALTQFYSDLYMRRNFQNLQSSLNPDEIIVLGDIMDGGRQWTNDAQFDDELRRVHHVFEISDPTNTRVHWMAGNHDIGFGNDIVPAAYTRFVDTFGPTNFAVDIPGTEVSLIGLDTVSLSSGSHDQHGQPPNTSSIPSQPKIERATSSSNPYRILLSHIPLHRPSTSDCGPHRGNPPLREGIGYQYQNLVVESLSGEILDRIKPVAVFSGDDHDWCTTEHQSQLSNGPNTYIEHTVATFSWMQGNHHPGFAVLNIHKLKNDYTSTLLPNYQQDTHFLTRLSHDTLIHTQYCDLPNQLGIYIWY
ncbi:Metallo-dependent phosphatase-like protein, partial [Phlyctochytrium arcticum]